MGKLLRAAILLALARCVHPQTSTGNSSVYDAEAHGKPVRPVRVDLIIIYCCCGIVPALVIAKILHLRYEKLQNETRQRRQERVKAVIESDRAEGAAVSEAAEEDVELATALSASLAASRTLTEEPKGVVQREENGVGGVGPGRRADTEAELNAAVAASLASFSSDVNVDDVSLEPFGGVEGNFEGNFEGNVIGEVYQIESPDVR